MMRVLSFLCVLVVLVLNSVPCADAHEQEAAQTAIMAAGQQYPAAHADECTPFCHCSCCASTVVARLTGSPAVPFKASNFSYTAHFGGKSLDIPLPIFQPPKIV